MKLFSRLAGLIAPSAPSTLAGQPREYILLPASPLWAAASIVIALLLNILLKRAVWVPDFLALTLVFWTLRQPAWIGMAAAFALGLLMDVQQGALLGQHALAYVILSFLVQKTSRRLFWFPPAAQALHLLPMLLLAQAVVLLVRSWGMHAWPGWQWFLASLFAAMLWPLWNWILLIPQRRSKNDETSPL